MDPAPPEMNIQDVAQRWFLKPQLEKLGDGHIHDTYLVVADGQRYVLQKVSQAVFQDPDLVMRQTQRVLQQWSTQSVYAVPELVANKEGQHGCWLDGQYYRVWRYLEKTSVVDPLHNLEQAQAAGAAFGALQACLADLAPPKLVPAIEGFLHLEHYLHAYDAVADEAPRHLHALIDRNRTLSDELGSQNATIHGDCKINNLLFDERGEQVVAVIDFDTVMYGHWAWDFGDLVRSVCFSAKRTSPELFLSCLRGFAAHQPLTTAAAAAAAPGYVTLMLGVRFLTDHLSGDHYFKVDQAGENLHRAQEQFDLFTAFKRQRGVLTDRAGEVLAKVVPVKPRQS
jgi:Ser/Thr protein kinase RdoA (MazF antagonist)